MTDPRQPIDPERLQSLAEAVKGIQNLPAFRALAENVGSSNAKFIRDLAANMPRVEVPSLRVDFKSLFPDLAAFNARLSAQLTPVLEMFQSIQREQFKSTFDRFQDIVQAGIPANWRGLPWPSTAHLESMFLDEGLALAWVPRQQILGRVFAATTPQQRRDIIGRSWRSTVASCRQILTELAHPAAKRHTRFAINALEAIEQGNPARIASAKRESARQYPSSRVGMIRTGRPSRGNGRDLISVSTPFVSRSCWAAFGAPMVSTGSRVVTDPHEVQPARECSRCQQTSVLPRQRRDICHARHRITESLADRLSAHRRKLTLTHFVTVTVVDG